MIGLVPLLRSFLYVINSLTGIVILFALVFFFWNLAVFILNAGNEEKRTEGRKKMLWGVIIFTVMFGVWGIVHILLVAFGIDAHEAELFIPPLFPEFLPN